MDVLYAKIYIFEKIFRDWERTCYFIVVFPYILLS